MPVLEKEHEDDGRRLVGGVALALCLGRFGDSAAVAAASIADCTVAAVQAKAAWNDGHGGPRGGSD